MLYFYPSLTEQDFFSFWFLILTYCLIQIRIRTYKPPPETTQKKSFSRLWSSDEEPWSHYLLQKPCKVSPTKETLCAPSQDRLCPQCSQGRNPAGPSDREFLNRVQAFPPATVPTRQVRSWTQNTWGNQTSGPPDSQRKQAERLHTAGSTHVRMSDV